MVVSLALVQSYDFPTASEAFPRYHDDVIKWKHFPRYWPFMRGIRNSSVAGESPPPHIGQWCGALMFSLICAWINDWVNTTCGWWFDVSLWRHCNDVVNLFINQLQQDKTKREPCVWIMGYITVPQNSSVVCLIQFREKRMDEIYILKKFSPVCRIVVFRFTDAKLKKKV